MNTTLSDLEQRRQAVDPARSFIVQAPAGSGKTGLLIQRYLCLLATVDAPEEIIAITFTRKAAAEMQGRILEALDWVISEQSLQHEYQQQTRELAAAVLQRSRELDWQLEHNPGRLRIQTIDSLCAGLVRQMPLLSGTGGLQDIAEDARPLYEQAAEASLLEMESSRDWGRDVSKLLLHLDNDLPRLKELLVQMLQKRDQWLRYVVQGYAREALEQAIANLVEEKLQRARSLIPTELEADLCKCLRFAADNLAPLDPGNPIVLNRDHIALPAAGLEYREHWAGIAHALTTAGGTWRVGLNKNVGFPPAGKGKADTDENARMKEQMKYVLHGLAEVDGLEAAIADIKLLPPLSITDAEWAIIEALCRLLTLAAAQLQLTFNDRNQLDFIGVAQAAVTALGSDESPTDLAMYLDYRVSHILVDEFQDISVNQYDLLRRLTAGWTQDDGRSLFLVGDPMQSIYRFREAEVSNFIHTFHHGRLGDVSLQGLVLNANFRSSDAIVDWVNNTFDKVFSSSDDLTTGAVSFHPSVAAAGITSGPGVQVVPLFDDSATEEAQHIAAIITDIQGKTAGENTAILVRNRSHLREIIPALRDAGIVFRAIDIEGLGDNPAIQDMLALTRAWFFSADRTAWLSLLRAPWCGLELATLFSITEAAGQRPLVEALHDETLINGLAGSDQLRIARLMNAYDRVNAVRHRQSVRASIESLWSLLGGPATLSGVDDLNNVNTYLGLLEQLERGAEIEDLEVLEQQVAGLFGKHESLQAGDSVQLLTMHKAKGLEFDHVILPGLGRGPRYSNTELMKWILRPREDGGHDLFIGAIRETGQDHTPVYQYIQNVEKQKDAFEEQRLIYVAATRARQGLYLTGGVKTKADKQGGLECQPPSRSLLGHLWPVLESHYMTALQEQPVTPGITEAVSRPNVIKRLPAHWTVPQVEQELPSLAANPGPEIDMAEVEYEWAGETIKRVGSIVHQCILQIARDGLDDWDTNRVGRLAGYYRLMLAQAGLSESELDAGCDQVINALTAMLEDERGRWILSPEHTESRNEYAITGRYLNRVVNAVIDRTFIDNEGTRWIVDYKNSRHEGPDLDAFLDQERQRYTGQMVRYATLMRAMDARPIKLGLYFPLLQGWREWGF